MKIIYGLIWDHAVQYHPGQKVLQIWNSCMCRVLVLFLGAGVVLSFSVLWALQAPRLCTNDVLDGF